MKVYLLSTGDQTLLAAYPSNGISDFALKINSTGYLGIFKGSGIYDYSNV